MLNQKDFNILQTLLSEAIAHNYNQKMQALAALPRVNSVSLKATYKNIVATSDLKIDLANQLLSKIELQMIS